VQGGDNIIAEPLIYARQSAMITGAGTTPSLFALNAESRPSLADAIYGSKSLTKITADLRQVFVLRKNRKAYDAFQLDLSNPSRLILARNFEMRPDDIVYVSTQPLTEFNTIAGQLISTFTGLLDTTRKIEGI
jgi:polysaccharide export outer membrane protein